MKTRHYERSEIVSFYELTEEQQKEELSNNEEAQDNSYVIFENEPLNLGMFMRTEGGLFDGIYGTSYFSAYFIKLSPCGSMAVVADRYC